jgi:hypothetical protein
MYQRRDVAATNGTVITPRGTTLDGVYHQQPRDVVENAEWGFSNHGSSWRARTWAEHPFREDLPAAEDKEWSWRVLAAGWTIAYSPHLAVTDSHRRQAGPAAYARRVLKERGALASMGAIPPISMRQALEEWWNPEPHWVRTGSLRRSRVSPWRMIDVACTVLADHRVTTTIDVPALAEIRRLAGSRDPSSARPAPALGGALPAPFFLPPAWCEAGVTG